MEPDFSALIGFGKDKEGCLRFRKLLKELVRLARSEDRRNIQEVASKRSPPSNNPSVSEDGVVKAPPPGSSLEAAPSDGGGTVGADQKKAVANRKQSCLVQ